MPTFTYQVRDRAGGNNTGSLVAANSDEASRMLRREGYALVSLQENASGGAGNIPAEKPKKIKRDDIIYFASQLAVMVDTGVPLPEALDSIAEQSEHTGIRKIAEDLSDEVKNGTEFSIALDAYPNLFGNLFIALMKASEASGTMGQMLERASEYMQQERDLRKKIKGAMTYPVVMLSFCILAVTALLLFVLPRFENIYSGKGAMLPLPTRILLDTSNFVTTYWPGILAALVLAGIGFHIYRRSPAGSLVLDRLKICIPVLGSMYRKAYLARSLRTLATMVSTGVGIIEGLEITAAGAGNQLFSEMWLGVADGVREGRSVSEVLFENKLMPGTISQMILAGERTGRLATVMNRVAVFCETDLAVAVKTMTNMIEPAMIVVMGLIVGGIAMALLLPIFSVSRVVAT